MRLLASLLLLVFSATGFAQRSSVDVAGGVHYSYRTLSTDQDDGNVANPNEQENGILTGHLGIHYRRQLAERLFLRFGVRLSALGYASHHSGLRWGSQHDGAVGYDPALDPTLPASLAARKDLFFLELPLLVHRTFGGGRWIPFLEAGLLPGAYLTTRSRLSDPSREEVFYFDERQGGVHRFHLGAAFAVGTDCVLSDRYRLFVQSNLRYQLSPVADGPVRERLYAGGVSLGLRRTFP
ncbi:hypothetical protein CLV84_1471 [Neolewinella xylanilytica]|uniref:Outer membrane protein with beta-barrel domain n=1 Tax=Neolewinella xylanilytica TaxID=1514080 RepID=A0A2S6IAH5_9BACT|nr:hypothetical protein [Neolewinella xylanilytica]PPK88503.1 hypothetical protein CLV84_1471 [Neolewinella xylanilytica]